MHCASTFGLTSCIVVLVYFSLGAIRLPYPMSVETLNCRSQPDPQLTFQQPIYLNKKSTNSLVTNRVPSIYKAQPYFATVPLLSHKTKALEEKDFYVVLECKMWENNR